MYRLKHNIQIKPKEIIGYIILLNVLPSLGILINWTNEGALIGYLNGWLVNIALLTVIGFSFLLIWCFND